MNKDKDYYKILGIGQDCDKKEIKKAYRQLARKFHPDINPGNKLFEEKFNEIGEAYFVLIDDSKRIKYDMLRGIISMKQDSAQAKTQASKAYSEPRKDPPKAPPKKDFEGIFSKFSKNFTKPDAEKGDDITTDVHISIAEAYNGTIRKVNILRTEKCYKCRGNRVINHMACDKCNGTGEISTHKQLNVKIPPKVKENSKIRIAGEGNKGLNGGENGDLYLLIHTIKSSYFTYDGLHVHCEVPITPSEAALGGEIQVPSIEGFINMKIPAETRSGQKFKLAGEGLPDTNSSKRGDQIVTVKIEIPPNLTEDERRLYLELARVRKFNPREHIIFDK